MLSIKRPTPTTVLYTVSTRSPARTLSAQVRIASGILARIFTGFLVLAILSWEFRVSQSLSHALQSSWLVRLAGSSLRANTISTLTANSSRPWRLLATAALTWLIFRKGYTEESLLVIRGLGVQTSTSSPSYLSTSSTRFIPTSTIQDIFIHEAFKGFEVRFYLCIVVEGEEDVVVVFPVRDRPMMRWIVPI